MKRVTQAAAAALTGLMLAAAGMWTAGMCPWLTCIMIWLGCGSGLTLCLHELSAMRKREEREREAARRSAYRAELFRQIDRL